jgi:pimeloyl-ACP methyl ester carboxylesterase
VPADPAAYKNEHLIEDLAALLRHLGVARAHVGGLSMGGNVALNFGIAHPEMAASLIVCACGSGTVGRETFLAESERTARLFLEQGAGAAADHFAALASRRGFAEKDPRGWAEFLAQLREHSPEGSAFTMRGVQMRRKTIFELETELMRLEVPTLIVVGDQDEPCIEPSLFMKRHIPHAGLLVVPMSGHTVNIEEPGAFNTHVAEFLAAVENGRWGAWKA